MTNKKDISHVIESQFPAIYREEGEALIDFVNAYYDFVSHNSKSNDEMLDGVDLDKSVDEFVSKFKETYLADFPFVTSTDKRFMIRHIMDYYRAKGSVESTKLILRLLFNEESSVYFPSSDIFKLSDSEWVEPTYIEVEKKESNSNLIDKEISGSRSGAKGIVEGVVTKRINGRYIDVLYLSNLRGAFLFGEKVTADGELRGAPTVTGSLTDIQVRNGGRNNRVGDIFEAVGAGRQGKVRVAAVENGTGRVDFNLLEGGSGYTTTDRTNIYISDGVLTIDNENLEFMDFERVSQQMETVELISAGDIFDAASRGNYFTGMNPNGVQVANGTIVESSKFFNESNTEIVSVKLVINSGTFDKQEKINLSSNASFIAGEHAEEESTVEITVANETVAFTVGHRVDQATMVDYGSLTGNIVVANATGFVPRETIVQYNANNEIAATAEIASISGNTLKVRGIYSYSSPGEFVTGKNVTGLNSAKVSNVTTVTLAESSKIYNGYAFGTVFAYDGATKKLTLKPAWGTFEPGLAINAFNGNNPTPTATASVQAVNVPEIGARGRIAAQPTANSIIVDGLFGSFTGGKKVRGDKSKRTATITTVANEGATDVWLNGNSASNGVIDLIANTTASAMVIGQNTSSIGVHGNTVPFFASKDITIDSTNNTVNNIVITDESIGQAKFYLTNSHNFAVGDLVRFDIDLLIAGEIQSINTVTNLTSRNIAEKSITVNLTPAEIAILKNEFTVNMSSVMEVVSMPIRTNRAELISPPRDANGAIRELNLEVARTSGGRDANFVIGSLENEETVFINTDLISANNTVGVPYTGIQINGANSGVGFVDSIFINSGGSGYSNGEVITFTGGGYADGEPLIGAYGIVATNASGAIIDVQIANHGMGYWKAPTLKFSGNNATANLSIGMDFGYGFPKSPNGDLDTVIQDCLTMEQFTIGTIANLGSINPGADYTADPYVRVYNKYVAGFNRADFFLVLRNVDGNFRVGENLSQNVGGSEFAKGIVLATTGDILIVRRTSFNTAFSSNIQIVGDKSGATGLVDRIETLQDSHVMGDNANFDTKVISANGIATSLEVIDSGFGYLNDGEITLKSADTNFVMSGVSKVERQGKGTGYWNTVSSNINSNAKIHDNKYYQEYAYEVIVGRSVDKYEKILKNILHVSGTELFGRVENRRVIKTSASVKSSITVS
tara:strand:+ start:365 stop:3931 length:3567 start_codon:yes stop_codon:yes gene_type:complete